ncbi:hypothetical protein F383_34517 [Gossypium arboreum]|uniref:Uncharacterized protein n=1 Tax=Gossypium arboreum TaxID=29729 RepID=A0A0B0MZI4_GOSAR|nr:hypothetical protein F383_34517 [Gossypium arboreum]
MMNPASEMDKSASLEYFLTPYSPSPSSPLLTCIYRLWNAYEPSKMAFFELDSTWARQGHARVTRSCVITSGCVRACQIDTAVFEDGLNEDIKLLVCILEIKEFVVLVERACKAEELGKEKKKADFEARDARKRTFGKSFQSASKKFRDDFSRTKATSGYSRWDQNRPSVNSRAISVASVGNVRSS